MIPLALICSLFIFWTLVGRSILAVFNANLGVLRSWLIAPAMGLSAMVILLMGANQAGIPVKECAWYITLFISAITCVIYTKRSVIIPFRQLSIVAFILSACVVLIGWPALRLGFNWISFVTDDFINYCLAGDRFKTFGFYRSPTVAELTGTDYTQYFWFMHVPAQVRFGAEHQLAWLSTLTGLRTVQVFMPVIISLGCVQVTSLAALVLHKNRFRKQAFSAAFILSISPLFVFSAVYQLIAQVGGLSLMLTLVTLLTAVTNKKSRYKIALNAIPAAIVTAAVAMFYPEVTPFAALTIGVFFFIEWYISKSFAGTRIVLYEYVLICFIIILRHNLVSYIYSLSNQLVGGLRKTDLALSLFPFFLIPSGLSALFGLQALNADIAEPLGSILVFVGAFLLIATALFGLRYTLKGYPYAILLLIQITFAVALFKSGNDFGTYKMAMFMQPVLMAAVVFLFSKIKPKAIFFITSFLLIALMIKVDIEYTRSSAGKGGVIVAEVQNVSAALVKPPAPPKPQEYWLSSIDNIIAAKLAGDVYRGGYLKFPSRDLFPVSAYLINDDWPLMQFYPYRSVYQDARALMSARNELLYKSGQAFGADFSEPKADRKPTQYLSLTSERNLFNKLHSEPSNADSFFVVKPIADVKNLLIFVHSSLGSHYYLGDRKVISFYQQESDYYDTSVMANAMGRFMLLRIERPSDLVYLRIAASKTLMPADRKEWSKQAVIRGTQDLPIPFVGSGAANLIVGPFKPLKVGDSYYIALDFGEKPRPFPSIRSGLKAMYNRNIPLDYRWLVSYGRDISVLSPEDYKALNRPTRIENFPNDIVKASALEFSGLYEDGWFSPEARVVLGQSNPGDGIRLRLQVPQDLEGYRSPSDLKITVNDETMISLPVMPADYDWLLPIKHPGKKTDIRFSFSTHGILAKGDDRVVSAALKSLRIVNIKKIDFTSPTAPKPPFQGIDLDGWIGRDAIFDVPVSEQSQGIILEVDYPGWWNIPLETAVNVSLDEGKVSSYHLKQGRNRLVILAHSGVSMHRVKIHADRMIALPPPDNRQRSCCLVSAESNELSTQADTAGVSSYKINTKFNFSHPTTDRPSSTGIDASDGWSDKDVSLELPVFTDASSVVFEIEYPGWPHIAATSSIKVTLDGGSPLIYTLTPGTNIIKVPAPVGFSVRSIRIESDKSFMIPAPDSRIKAFQLISVESN